MKTRLNFTSESNTNIPDFDWLDSNTLIRDTEGNLTGAGTCIKLNDYIIFLKGLNEVQLENLRIIVNCAVSHELEKRSNGT